jgi:hypothetical protein
MSGWAGRIGCGEAPQVGRAWQRVRLTQKRQKRQKRQTHSKSFANIGGVCGPRGAISGTQSCFRLAWRKGSFTVFCKKPKTDFFFLPSPARGSHL